MRLIGVSDRQMYQQKQSVAQATAIFDVLIFSVDKRGMTDTSSLMLF
jgi:hypothetical protein